MSTIYRNGIKYGGSNVQVQTDFAQTDTEAVDYIKNKPTKVSDFTNDLHFCTSTEMETYVNLVTLGGSD